MNILFLTFPWLFLSTKNWSELLLCTLLNEQSLLNALISENILLLRLFHKYIIQILLCLSLQQDIIFWFMMFFLNLMRQDVNLIVLVPCCHMTCCCGSHLSHYHYDQDEDENDKPKRKAIDATRLRTIRSCSSNVPNHLPVSGLKHTRTTKRFTSANCILLVLCLHSSL